MWRLSETRHLLKTSLDVPITVCLWLFMYVLGFRAQFLQPTWSLDVVYVKGTLGPKTKQWRYDQHAFGYMRIRWYQILIGCLKHAKRLNGSGWVGPNVSMTRDNKIWQDMKTMKTMNQNKHRIYLTGTWIRDFLVSWIGDCAAGCWLSKSSQPDSEVTVTPPHLRLSRRWWLQTVNKTVYVWLLPHDIMNRGQQFITFKNLLYKN